MAVWRKTQRAGAHVSLNIKPRARERFITHQQTPDRRKSSPSINVNIIILHFPYIEIEHTIALQRSFITMLTKILLHNYTRCLKCWKRLIVALNLYQNNPEVKYYTFLFTYRFIIDKRREEKLVSWNDRGCCDKINGMKGCCFYNYEK